MTRRELISRATSLRDDFAKEGLASHAKILTGVMELTRENKEPEIESPLEWPSAAALVNVRKANAFRLEFLRWHTLENDKPVMCQISQAVLLRGLTLEEGETVIGLTVDGQDVPQASFRTKRGYAQIVQQSPHPDIFMACELDSQGQADPLCPVGIFLTNGSRITIHGKAKPDAALYGCAKITRSAK